MVQRFIEWLKGILDTLGFEGLANPEENELEGVILFAILSGLATLAWKGISWGIKRYRQQQLKKDLMPYYSFTDIKFATQYFVPTQFQNVPPSRHDELAVSTKTIAREPLLHFFLNEAFKPQNNDQRFYMVLAGSGMGKTTFMLNLYMRYIQKRRFIRNPYEIFLFPLGAPNLLKHIAGIKEPENAILLLDGLDEDTQAVRNYKARLKEILESVQEFRTVVFTCRTQFFPSDAEVPKITHLRKFGSRQGFQSFDILYIAPFNQKDINLYLKKRFRWYQFKIKKKAREIIAYSPTLMVRPMVLSYVDDLLETTVDYYFTSHLYEAMIQKWIEREKDRVDPERQEKFRDELYRFSKAIALNMYDHRRHRGGLFIGEKEIRPFSEKHRIQLQEIEMRSRSLLNRDANGHYKFAHKSILEYFLARIMVDRPAFAAQFSFDGMDQARVFYNEMCLNRTTLPLFKELKEDGMARLPEEDPKSVDQFRPTEVKRLVELSLKKAKRIEAVGPLTKLKRLTLDHTDVKEISPLEDLTRLEHLSLSQTGVEDLRPLARLENLQFLCLDGTNVKILDPLHKLTELRILQANHTFIAHLEALQGMEHLQVLGCNRTQVKDLNPVRKLAQLQELQAYRTPVASLSPLRDLSNLRVLNLGRSKVKNISAIRGLTKLEHLNLDHLQLGDWSIVKRLTNLRVFSALQSNFAHLEILAELPNLEELHISQCPIENLQALSSIPSLQVLSVRRMPLPAIEVLAALPNLRQIHVSRSFLDQTGQRTWERKLPEVEIITSEKARTVQEA